MTPQGWQFDNLVLVGVAWMFGGALVALPLAWWLGRRRDTEFGLGAALLLWGLGNLLVCAWVVVFIQFESRVLLLKPTRCEPSTDPRGEPQHLLFHALPASAGALREVSGPALPGVCPEGVAPTNALRVRNTDLASTTALLTGNPADDTPRAVMATWGMFGGIASLMGWLLLANRAGNKSRQAARELPDARPSRPIASWRKAIAIQLGWLGLLVFVAAFIGPALLDGSGERAAQFGLRSAAAAFIIWLFGSAFAGNLGRVAALVMLALAGALLGLGELVRLPA